MFLLGYDIGSSAIKATLMDAQTGKVLASATSPQTELQILAPQPGWAQQQPEIWWEHVKAATAEIKSKAKVNLADVQAIGLRSTKLITPAEDLLPAYKDAYRNWLSVLQSALR